MSARIRVPLSRREVPGPLVEHARGPAANLQADDAVGEERCARGTAGGYLRLGKQRCVVQGGQREGGGDGQRMAAYVIHSVLQ